MMFAVIFIPNFSLQAALRHEPDLRERPVALVDPKLARPVIVQLTAAAQAFGVAEGLTPSQATARCTELILKIRSPAQEESATEVLLQTACAFSPNFESTAPGVCTLELKGLPLGSNSDAMEPWAKTIRDILAQFYIDARIGISATPELALLAARAADPILVLNSQRWIESGDHNQPEMVTKDLPPHEPCAPPHPGPLLHFAEEREKKSRAVRDSGVQCANLSGKSLPEPEIGRNRTPKGFQHSAQGCGLSGRSFGAKAEGMQGATLGSHPQKLPPTLKGLRSDNGVHEENPLQPARVEPINRECGASFLPLLAKRGEGRGEESQGTGGEASLHEGRKDETPRVPANENHSTAAINSFPITALEPPNHAQPATSSPSPPRSGGEGRDEEALGAQGAKLTPNNRIHSFPITALEPPPETLEILRRWGIHTVGALLALDKNDVTERLGPAVAELLKRVSPGSPRPLKLVTPPETFSEQIEFENEIETAEPLLFVLRRFVEQLSRRLELIYLVISEFQLQLGLSSGAKYERTFKIPAPTANIEILFRMLQTHLETVRTDSSITSLRLAAKPARAEAQQFGLFESSLRDPNQFAETLAQLTALVGSDNIGTPEPVPSHKPDSFRMTVPEFNGQMERARLGRSVSNVRRKNSPKSSRIEPTNRKRGASLLLLFREVEEKAGMRRSQGKGGEAFPPEVHGEAHRTAAGITAVAGQAAALHSKIGLSLRRFRPPMPSQVEFRDEKPSLLRCRIFIGPVVETRGPFLSSGNWWDAGRWTRQEWDVKTSDGSLLRIFLSSDGCFVEGTYD